MTRRVLVTGGAGYIGSHTCKALAESGIEPVVLDDLSHGHRWAVKWGPFEEGSLLDPSALDKAFRKHRVDAVMHFAAFAYVGESVQHPAKYYRNNVMGTFELLEAARRNDVGKFIFSSTCATYGIPCEVPISESQVQDPINPYGRSKLMIEQILKDYVASYGMAATALRYFNAAGADPDAEIGEWHDPETHLIPLVLQVATGHRDSITVFGTDYDTPDGTCIRDYIHVSDLAAAHVLALDGLDAKDHEFAYNLGNGNGYSVAEVIDACARVTGKPIPRIESERRIGDPPTLVGDARLIADRLGWRPEHASLESMIKTAWDWEQSDIRAGRI